MNKIKIARNSIVTFNTLFVFVGVVASIVLLIWGSMVMYKVFLRDDIVPDVSGPVSRFIADIDFENRTVNFDATITKSTDADQKITIWRLGDGKVIKSVGAEDIVGNELIEYTYDKPGTYQIGYSVIDDNDLSDEAFCTITFKDDGEKRIVPSSPELSIGFQIERNGEYSNVSDEGFRDKDLVSDQCGKSYTSYNSDGGIYSINESKSEIREAFFIIGVGVVTFIFSLVVHILVKKLFTNKLK